MQTIPDIISLIPGASPFLTIKKYPKKGVIFFQGNARRCLYEIISGEIKISKFTGDGREITIEILEPGERFSFLPLVDGGLLECTATALSDSSLYFLDERGFRFLEEQHPAVYHLLLEDTCKRLRKAYEQMENIFTGGVQKRITRIILELGRQEGHYNNNRLTFSIRLTHQELANLAGTTRETVTRSLASLKKQGLIEVHRSEISIADESKLEQLC